jgi:ABC-type branched-subunit amino acid transport system ATPase component/ABC-type branched-subunit amino acid transport system permease subunit
VTGEGWLALLVLGAVLGAAYGTSAVGVVLVHRSDRVVNLAHADIGALGAAVALVAVRRLHWPYLLAVALALVVAVAVAVAARSTIVRRLVGRSWGAATVATLGLGQLLSVLSLALTAGAGGSSAPLQPPGLPPLPVGPLTLPPATTALLVCAPLAGAAVVWLLHRTAWGLALRAAADDAVLARTAGIDTAATSALAWSLAAVLASGVAILTAPLAVATGAAAGTGLLVRVLAVAVAARMSSAPVALGVGVAVGIAEQLLGFLAPTGGAFEAGLLVLVAGTLVGTRSPRRRQPPERADPLVVTAGGGRSAAAVALLVVAAAVAVPGLSARAASTVAAVAALAVVGLSVMVLAAWAGQLSLGQFAVAGLGAVASVRTLAATGNVVAALVAAGLVGAAASAVVVAAGLVRRTRLDGRGLGVPAVTLTAAVAVQLVVLPQPWALGSGGPPGRPSLWGVPLDRSQRYAAFALVVLAAALWGVHGLRRSRLGRQAQAVRDDPDAAEGLGLRTWLVRLQVMAISGALAGVGGAVYGHALARLAPLAFPAGTSTTVAVLAAVGGLGSPWGAVLGAAWVVGVPALGPSSPAALAGTAFGSLLVLLHLPAGIASLGSRRAARPGRSGGGWRPPTTGPDDLRDVVAGLARRPDRPPAGAVVLRAAALAKAHGGVQALAGVDVAVRAGEVLAVVGDNGAGKTTLLDVLSGVVVPDAGAVHLRDRDVTAAGPAARAGLGLVRCFSDSTPFPTLTAGEVVDLAAGHLPGPERQDRVAAVMAALGLQPVAGERVGGCPAPVRQVVKLACAVAADPVVLLVDEPSAGLDRSEVAFVAAVLRALAQGLGAAVVVVDHDRWLVGEVADRVLHLRAGAAVEGALVRP